jgi:hypothetical protein
MILKTIIVDNKDINLTECPF